MMLNTGKKRHGEPCQRVAQMGVTILKLDQTTTRRVAIAISSNVIGGVRIYAFLGRHYRRIGGKLFILIRCVVFKKSAARL